MRSQVRVEVRVGVGDAFQLQLSLDLGGWGKKKNQVLKKDGTRESRQAPGDRIY